MKVVRLIPRTKQLHGVYIDGRLQELLHGFHKAVTKHNTSVVFIIDGRSGMGKTTLANQIGIILDKNYNLNKIHYSPETFLQGDNEKIGLANAKKGDFILFDEAMLISNRSTLSQINTMIIQAMSMIRSKNIYVCFCVNSIFDLDRNLAISRADLLLHVYGQSLINRGRFAGFFKGKDGFDRLKTLYLLGKKYYNYGKPKANFIGSFTSEFIVDEELYEKQKQVSINKFLQGRKKPLGKRAIQALEARNRMVRALKEVHKCRMEQLMKYTNLSEHQVQRILTNNELVT